MSLRQSMYTGLAQPDVKTNGLPSEKCTAFTSSIIFAVISAMKFRSAKSMRRFYLRMPCSQPKGNGYETKNARRRHPAVVAACRRRAVLPLHQQGRQEVLRLGHADAMHRPAGRGTQRAGQSHPAHRPGG